MEMQGGEDGPVGVVVVVVVVAAAAAFVSSTVLYCMAYARPYVRTVERTYARPLGYS